MSKVRYVAGCVLLLLGIGGGETQAPSVSPSRFPVVPATESTQPRSSTELPLGTLFEKSWKSIPIHDEDAGTTRKERLILLGSHEPDRRLPAVPIEQSDVVLIAEVTSASAHLSTHGTTVYSQYVVKPTTYYKRDREAGDEATLTVLREGGDVLFPSGDKTRVHIPGQGPIGVGKNYALFLSRIPSSKAFLLITAFELGETAIDPVDTSNTGKFKEYERMDKQVFLNLLAGAPPLVF